MEGRWNPQQVQAWTRDLTRLLGPPVFKSAFILVWEVK